MGMGMGYIIRSMIILASLTGSFAWAMCTTDSCDYDCKRCPFWVVGCRDSCLAAERTCVAGETAAHAVCESQADYQLIVQVGVLARRNGLLDNPQSCWDAQKWAGPLGYELSGPVGAFLGDVCGCFACQDIMAAPDGNPPTNSNPDAVARECESLADRYDRARRGEYSGGNLNNLEHIERVSSQISSEMRAFGCPPRVVPR